MVVPKREALRNSLFEWSKYEKENTKQTLNYVERSRTFCFY